MLPGFQSSLRLPRLCLLVSPENGSFPLVTTPVPLWLILLIPVGESRMSLAEGKHDDRLPYFIRYTGVFFKIEAESKPVQPGLVILSTFATQGYPEDPAI